MSLPRITGSFLKQLRKNSGLTQEELSVRVGVTQGYIAQIERERADPKLSLVNKILDALEGVGDISAAKDVMTSEVLVGRSDQVTEELTELMLKQGYSQVPIVNAEGIMVGALVESDLLVRIMKEGQAVKTKRVSEVMSPPLPSFHERASIEMIEQVLEKVPAVVITDDRSRLVGLITRSDLLELLP